MKPVVNVLWTGGLDSTCRIVELSKLDVTIQPYYLNDHIRDSIKYELKAIRTITDVLRSKKDIRCDLRDVILIDVNSLAEDEKIRKSWKKLHDLYKIGTQYDWIARFAKQNELQLEMSLEKSPRGKASATLNGEAVLIKEEKCIGVSEYKIDIDASTQDAVNLFENLRFPTSLWSMTKEEEVEEMKELDCGDVMKMTWFCYTPVFGMPCGHCNPCKDALNEGMAYRVPKLGRVLGFCQHYTYHALRHVYRVVKKKFNHGI